MHRTTAPGEYHDLNTPLMPTKSSIATPRVAISFIQLSLRMHRRLLGLDVTFLFQTQCSKVYSGAKSHRL